MMDMVVVVLCLLLDLMIPEVFPNINDPVSPWDAHLDCSNTAGEHKELFPTNTTISCGWQGSAAAKLPKSAMEKGAWSVLCSSWVTVTQEFKQDSQLAGVFFSLGHLSLH